MTVASRRRHPLEGLARDEALGRVLTRPGRRGWEDAGPIRYLIVGFTDGPWSSRYWPTPFPWKDATRDAGRAPFVVVRRLDGGAPVTEPVGFAKSVHMRYFERHHGPGWELEPADRAVRIERHGTCTVVTEIRPGEAREVDGSGYARKGVPAGSMAPGDGATTFRHAAGADRERYLPGETRADRAERLRDEPVPRSMSDFGERSSLGRCTRCGRAMEYLGGVTACPECD